VRVVYATSSFFCIGADSRISHTVSPAAGTKRKRGCNQFLGNSAPGVSPTESCGSITQGPGPAKSSASPNSAAALAGGGVGPSVSKIGAAGKSSHGPAQPMITGAFGVGLFAPGSGFIPVIGAPLPAVPSFPSASPDDDTAQPLEHSANRTAPRNAFIVEPLGPCGAPASVEEAVRIGS
jgi:hypothetical protein